VLKQRVQVGVRLEGGVGGSRPTEAAGVIPDNTKVRYEDLNLFIPHAVVEITAVEQHDCGPTAERLVIEPAAGDCDKSRVGRR